VATFAIVLPLALALVFVGVQVALWAVAAHAASLAATEGAAAASVDLATGGTTATTTLHDLAGGLVHDPAVSVSEAGAVVQVHIQAGVVSLFPGLPLDVTARASLAAQTFRAAE
jgi:hypothetical protein